ncbi:CYTH domain-containing protein [Marinobacter sp. ANT_B65]|uniref:CYTH domain-containing protein n=1 Tax=Marinobacter sp. ANT_B65 TaxID=2039467 RepID=UPI000BBE7112|nr:CYTH domain-containing protein [Marinobacter sp. ANT_B65]PCM42818.1 CYTH domain-containing protein [Marinobacter sp. ANT_B65]
MAEELEIKLSIDPDCIKTVLNWLLTHPEAAKGGKKLLVNCYYDTPEAELNRQHAALRVRQAGSHFIQTLKTRGEFVGGAHRRQEWEWPVAEASLSLGLLADTPLGDNINLARLAPVFETNFTRQIVMLDDGKAVIECALDSGVIKSAGHQKPLNEVEFELKSGDPSRLLVWAERLARHCPVFLNLISKAEQGYYLAGIRAAELSVTDSAVSTDARHDDFDCFLRQLSKAWLTESVVSFDGVDVQALHAEAEACGLGQAFSRVAGRLAGGESLSGVLSDPEMGQCQLGMLLSRQASG